jgi:hypothetical protein
MSWVSYQAEILIQQRDSRAGSIEIRRIPIELPHSTELEQIKIHGIRTYSGRASVLKLLQGLLTSWEVLQPSEPRLSLYSTKNKLGRTIGS